MLPRLLITGGSGLLAKSWTYARQNKNAIYLAEHKTPCTLHGSSSLKFSLDSVDKIVYSLKEHAIDICVHTAGLTSVELCEKDPVLARFANTTLAENIALACAKLEIPLISISTDHLFSGRQSLANEDSIADPMNVYGSSKAWGETATLAAYPSALIVRTNFYGWGYSYRPSFSDFIFNKLNSGQSVGLFTDIFYTPIIATTLANICHDLIDMGASGIVNVVGSERLTKHDFGIKLAFVFGLDSELIEPIKFNQMSNLIDRPRDMSLSNSKLLNIIKYRIPSLEEQLLELKIQHRDKFFNS
jgi:dTDP-4-dehydrorhamnose reductase